ncbi:MAG: SRPBCC domain-containing protein [Chitinophagaceae bacterium]|nr:SRPBCC domain-containing protein [Chitinophagaceae bacterium]
MGDFTTTIVVDQTPAEVFAAINNVKSWWQGDIEGGSDKPGDEFCYRMKDFHFSKQKITEFVPEKKVAWLITDSKLTFAKNQTEWTGTKIIFDISTVDGKTQLRFTHEGLAPGFGCYGACSNAWTALVQQSLHSLITTGKPKRAF